MSKKILMVVALVLAAGAALWAIPQAGRQEPPQPTEVNSTENAPQIPVQEPELPVTAVAVPDKPDDAEMVQAGDDEVVVSGRVVDEEGNAVAGADVVITNHGFAQPYRTTRSQADGSFRFDGFSVAEIAWTSFSHVRSYQTFDVQARKGLIRSKSKTCMLERGPFTDLTLTVFSAATASGTVVDLDGRTVADIDVLAYSVEGLVMKSYEYGDRAISDSLGRFEFTALRPGKYKLIMRQAYTTTTIGDRGKETGIEVSLKAGEHRTGLVLEYDRMFGIAGRVLQEDGHPIEGRTVHATGEWGTTGGAQAVTDKTGRYEITDLIEGSYEVVIIPGRSEYQGASQKHVAAGSKDVDFVLASKCEVAGQVLAEHTGLPIEHFQLGFFKRDKDLEYLRSSRGGDLDDLFDAISDPEGRFEVKAPHAGRTYVVVKAPGFAIAAEAIDFGNGKRVDNVVVRLKPTGSLKGVVKNSQGGPVENAAIFLGPVFQHLVDKAGNVVTDKDGTFTMGYSPHGVQVVSAYHPDYAPASVNVDSSRTQPEIVEIILTRGGTIEGHVTLPPEPGGQVFVTLKHSDGHFLSNDETMVGPDGTFKLTGLTPGEVLARVGIRFDDPPGCRTVPFSVLIQNNRVTTIDLELPPATSRIEGIVAITGVEATHETVWGYFPTPFGDEEHFTLVMPDGSYQLPHVPSGRGVLRLEARDNDGSQIETSIAVEVGEAEVIHQDLDMAY